MFWLIALLLGIVGAAPVFLSPDQETSSKAGAFTLMTIGFTLVGTWLLYILMPSTSLPIYGGFALMLLIWWIIAAVIACAMPGDMSHAIWFPIVLVIIMIITPITGAPIFRSGSYASLIGNIDSKNQKHWSQDVQPLNPTKIRLVPKEVAIALAKTTLTKDGKTLGSQFPLDENHCTLQMINKDYWYLIPLDFKGYSVWTKADYVPGYVKVSATDPTATPVLIDTLKMKYTPEAFFGDNIERMLYWKYIDKLLVDYSFESDDQGHIYWIVTVCHPTIAYGGRVVDGVVIFDPQTGKDIYVSKMELDAGNYAWIDRVMPLEFIGSYIEDWGEYKLGWWNAAWDHIDVLKGESSTLNYSADGRCVIVTPITSTNSKDEAMSGLMYTDARTGKSTYYTTSGGATEGAVIAAVNSILSFKKWHASSQVVYENIYGTLSALVPVLGENGNYMGLAIVKNANKEVAHGAMPQEALMEYQKIIMGNGGQITTENRKDVLNFTGKIARLGWDVNPNSGRQYYLYFNEFTHAFIPNSKLQSELSLTREGDLVSITYFAAEQAAVPVMEFHNLTLDLHSSKNEQAVQTQMNERKTEVAVKADVQDFRGNVKDMSDEQIKALLDKQKTEQPAVKKKKHK